MFGFPKYMKNKFYDKAMKLARTSITNLVTSRQEARLYTTMDISNLHSAYHQLSIALVNQMQSKPSEHPAASLGRVTTASVEKNDLFKAVAFVQAFMEYSGITHENIYGELPLVLKKHAPDATKDVENALTRRSPVMLVTLPNLFKLDSRTTIRARKLITRLLVGKISSEKQNPQYARGLITIHTKFSNAVLRNLHDMPHLEKPCRTGGYMIVWNRVASDDLDTSTFKKLAFVQAALEGLGISYKPSNSHIHDLVKVFGGNAEADFAKALTTVGTAPIRNTSTLVNGPRGGTARPA